MNQLDTISKFVKNLNIKPTFVDIIFVVHSDGVTGCARSSSRLKSLPFGRFAVKLSCNKTVSVLIFNCMKNVNIDICEVYYIALIHKFNKFDKLPSKR